MMDRGPNPRVIRTLRLLSKLVWLAMAWAMGSMIGQMLLLVRGA
jgi:hypothetical protein